MDQDEHSTPAAADRASAASVGAVASARHRATLAALLTALAGLVDAVGYIQLNQLFLSFMSGNSTHLGMTLAKTDWRDAVAAAAIIAAFVTGPLQAR